jgi:hypothetical protein
VRQDFQLPQDDRDWLEQLGTPFECVKENGVLRVVLHARPVPPGYQTTEVMTNVRIESGYPDTQIDMVYFYPPLRRLDGRPIGGVSDDTFDGKVWQRWSRHRTPANPWRPGIDSLATHFELVEEWLRREFRK